MIVRRKNGTKIGDLDEILATTKDLRKADLSGFTLRKADLSGINLSKAHLRLINLSGINLSGANLSKAYLETIKDETDC